MTAAVDKADDQRFSEIGQLINLFVVVLAIFFTPNCPLHRQSSRWEVDPLARPFENTGGTTYGEWQSCPRT